MVDPVVAQQAADHRVRFARLGQRRVLHHALPVERPERQDATVER
jgi:hypothetical protein